MKDPKEQAEAAARLAAAVTVLQKEASHTPGSGRSLDTIRRLLSAGQRVHPQQGRDGLNEIPPTAVSRLVENPEVSGSLQQDYSVNGNAGGHSLHAMPLQNAGTNGDEMGHVPLWDDDFAYGATNTGAGFHPDAFPWWSADSMPRMPPLSAWGHMG